MSNVERLLEEEKNRIDQNNAPPELESKLRNALAMKKAPRKNRKSIWIAVASIVIACVFVSYNYSAFAYYGKKIFGFDDIMTGTLSDLNEAGMGQVLEDANYTFENGTSLTLNGVMSDENKIIVFYTMTAADGLDEDTFTDISFPHLTGFLLWGSSGSGHARFNEERTELKGEWTYDSVPNAFAKHLTLEFAMHHKDGTIENGEITFEYDAAQAMQTKVKQTFDQRFEVDHGTISIKSITASPMSTVIKGRTNVDSIDRVQQAFDEIRLIANGEQVRRVGGSISSNLTGGSTFELEFDALPYQLNTMELKLDKFVGYEYVNATIALNDEDNRIAGEPLEIKQVAVEDGQTKITIATEETVLLDNVSIGDEQTKTALTTTVGQTLEKTSTDVILKERTLLFDTIDPAKNMYVGGFYYMKNYDLTMKLISEEN
ncbi:DUF4179 domain-containing protein [Radiobacillus sp. PE A8.2]|uniref:DUF4179 domain-containing protein n=1 Tax=Radiobacillus sp. PE A8.2 TaxID=3380349 RepID=UPI00388FFE9B